MNKEERQERERDILYFIYQNRIALIRHIKEMFFNSYERAKVYLWNLEKKGLIKAVYFYNIAGEKVCFLSYKGILFLKKRNYDVTRYKINKREFPHDIVVIDLVIYFAKKFKFEIVTDYMLRREFSKRQNKEGSSYKLPDFIFKTPKGYKGLVEYQKVYKPENVVRKYLEDYTAYYPGYAVYYVVDENKAGKYYDMFKRYAIDIKKYFICSFSLTEGLKILYKNTTETADLQIQ